MVHHGSRSLGQLVALYLQPGKAEKGHRGTGGGGAHMRDVMHAGTCAYLRFSPFLFSLSKSLLSVSKKQC